MANHLLTHPSVVAPLAKEIWTDNPAAWEPFFPTESEMRRVEHSHGKAITGLFSPWLHRVALMDHYKAVRPDGKVIVLLRDPVDRAYSHFKWEIAHGGLVSRRLDYFSNYDAYVNLALELFPSDPPMIGGSFQVLQSGIYVNAVVRWLEVFGPENVHVVNAGEMFTDLRATLRGIHDFLGIDPRDPVDFNVVNASPLEAAPPSTSSARAKLSEFYRPWNEQLYEVLGRDFGWS